MNIVTYETHRVEAEGLTLSQLIWRRFRLPMPGLLELTLTSNPGLAGRGSILPVGTVIKFPIPGYADRAAADGEPVRLW